MDDTDANQIMKGEMGWGVLLFDIMEGSMVVVFRSLLATVEEKYTASFLLAQADRYTSTLGWSDFWRRKNRHSASCAKLFVGPQFQNFNVAF